MRLYEKEIKVPLNGSRENLIPYLSNAIHDNLNKNECSVRFVVSKTDKEYYHCELGILRSDDDSTIKAENNIFRFVSRKIENSENFNVVLVVPTGIGAEIGGHDGDAAPVARLLAESCDNLITHPNVVNASDINEIPENGLYVEGSVLSRFLMGSIGLQPVRSNRILLLVDLHEDKIFIEAAINTLNAARATYGLSSSQVIVFDPPVNLTSKYSSSGRAIGEVEQLESIIQVLEEHKDEYDALAITSVINVPYSYHSDYFAQKGKMINPWGGIEAIFTHAISLLYDIPSAHAPMYESRDVANIEPGIVDPRMAAEAISVTFLQSVLKGLKRSPRIITDSAAMNKNGVMTASDISCLVIPDGCVGLPTLAALEQGIKVIAVKENKNIMKNDLSKLPWASDQFYMAENYWEVSGILNSIKGGIDPKTVRRPLSSVRVQVNKTESSNPNLDELDRVKSSQK
ncbi:MAG: DUF3326 domain-containing protein [Bacteroidetes bacterium]|nr:DUF3326 domain-containing protein [Bacteroidota bacterium]